MKPTYTIRRHLGNDQYKGHYQIREYKSARCQGDLVGYVNPATDTLKMYDVKLSNNVNLAGRILTGEQAKKKPCAWIICSDFDIVSNDAIELTDYDNCDEVTYNPRMAKNWMQDGKVMDDEERFYAITMDKEVYIFDISKSLTNKYKTI